MAGLLVPCLTVGQTPPTEPAAEVRQLSTIEVLGNASGGAHHVGSAAGTKSDVPVHELPQSVRVMTRQTLEDLNATRLDQVLDYVGGVTRQNDFGGLWDNIAIRGLPGNENTGMATLLNGFTASRGFNAPRDLAGVERIEFLKGPAAALYGSSEPGGTLNVVSKAPRWKPAHSVDLSGGSFGSRRASIDTSGPLSDRFAYRLNAAVEQSDGWRDFVGAKRQVLAPAFTWKLGRDTVLDYRGEWLRHATPLDRGVVAVNGRLGAVPTRRFLGEPADGDVTVDNQSHQFALAHALAGGWQARVALSLRRTSLEGFSTEATALRSDGSLTRQRRYRDFNSRDTALQGEVQGTFTLGGLEHELLVGAEAYRFTLDSVMRRINPSTASPYAVNIYAPVYGQAQPTPLPNTSTDDRQRNAALYLQDAIKLAEHWRLLAGLRFDRYDQSLANRLNGLYTAQSPTATSPRVGLSWLPLPQWTFYANAGRSFRPNTGSDAATRPFAPERARALEAGAKWQRADGDAGATLAVFDIRKQNVLTGDALNSGYSVAAGEVRSRGVELDYSGRIQGPWRLDASLALTDVEVTRDNTLEVGGRLIGIPRATASLLALYESATDAGQRWGLGGGVTHVGKRLGQARTQAEARAGTAAFDLPAYTTARIAGWWQVTPAVRLSLDVDNLFDKTFYASSYSAVWVAPGAPRRITAGLHATF